MASDRVALAILGTTFIVESSDERWPRLIGQLWEPFTIRDSPLQPLVVRIERDQRLGWSADLFGQKVVTDPDPWSIAAHVRIALFQRAHLEAPGIVALHAGVVARDGSALLIVGPGGTGKTSLTLDLLGEGWTYFSDDLAPIDMASGEVIAVPKPLHVTDVSRWPSCRPLWRGPSWMPPPATSFLLPPRVFPQAERATARPRFLVFPRFD